VLALPPVLGVLEIPMDLATTGILGVGRHVAPQSGDCTTRAASLAAVLKSCAL
jgi:hypothetical protein